MARMIRVNEEVWLNPDHIISVAAYHNKEADNYRVVVWSTGEKWAIHLDGVDKEVAQNSAMTLCTLISTEY